MDRIPKKLHLYWDKSPMSKLQVFTVETFHKLNPDWDIYVYTPIQNYLLNAQYIPNYIGKDFFSLISSLDYVTIVEVDISKYGIDSGLHNILRSDIFRYHILYNEGGMWSDFDIIWLKPINHMNTISYVGNVLMSEMGATACLYNMTVGHHNIGVLFGAPYHSLYKSLIDRSNEIQSRISSKGQYEHQSFGVTMWKDLYNSLQDVIDHHPDVVGIPYETFAPYSIFNLEQLFMQNDLSPLGSTNVIGLHWFNGHTYSKRYINENWFSDNRVCSLTTILKSNGYIDA
jgi:hypothetical protein